MVADTLGEKFVRGIILYCGSEVVHARWVDLSGKTVVNALAVASEPYIFWRGENAEHSLIFSNIRTHKDFSPTSMAYDIHSFCGWLDLASVPRWLRP